MSRRPGVEVGEPAEISRPHAWHRLNYTAVPGDPGERTRELVGRAADGEISKLGGAPATYGPLPAMARAGGFLDLVTLPAYERMP